jgi:hypothetical protein
MRHSFSFSLVPVAMVLLAFPTVHSCAAPETLSSNASGENSNGAQGAIRKESTRGRRVCADLQQRKDAGPDAQVPLACQAAHLAATVSSRFVDAQGAS